MKPRSFIFGHLLLPAALISFPSSAQALTKANNTSALNLAASWSENVAPASTDVLLFNSTGVPASGGLTVAAANATVGGLLQFTDIAGNVTITQGTNHTWTLGPSSNTPGFTGGIDMSAATADVAIGSSGRTLRWSSFNYGGISVASGRTLTINSNFTNAGNTKTIAMTGSGSIIFNGSAGAGGATSFNVNGANVTMNNATNTWVAGTITAGSLTIGNTTALQNQTVTNNAASGLKFSTGVTSATLGNLAGSGGIDLTNIGAGAVSLTVGGNNSSQTYSGALSGSGTLTKTGTGALTLTNTANAVAFTVSGGTLTGGVATTSNGGFGTGGITFKGGTIGSTMGANNTLALGNAITVGSGDTGTFNTPNRVNWTGNVSGAGALTVNVSTTVSRMDLNNNWTGFTGTANFTGSGGVRFFSNGGTFNANSFQNTAINIGDSVSFNPVTNSGGNTYQIGSLAGSSATAALNGGSAGPATYSIGGLNTSTTFAGAITGNSALTKAGSGTLTLGGTSTYTGATTVTLGTLLVNGALGNTAVTVNGGALGGTGTIGGAVTVNTGARLAPGASIESLAVASANLNGGSLVVEYDGTAGGTIDLLSVTGVLDITNGTVDFDMLGSAPDDPFYIFATYGSLNGSAFANILDLPGGYKINYAFNDGITSNNIALVPIPEPGAGLLGGLGILLLLRRRR